MPVVGQKTGRQKININVAELLVPIEVTIRGKNVAIHPSYKRQGWTVTSVTTGRSFLEVATEGDAVKVANVLTTFCATVFSQDTAKRIIKMMPKWVVRWRYACLREGKYLDHTPYLKNRA